MLKRMILTAAIGPIMSRFVPFEGGKAGWKTVKNGDVETIEMKDGNPIWLDANGAEAVIERDTIARLNREAQTHREGKEAAEAKLKAFDGIDPAKAKDALETVGKLDQKRLIDAGEVDRVKETMKSEFVGQIEAAKQEAANALKLVDDLRIETAFSASKFIGDKLAIPGDIVKATFGKNFKVEDGKIVAYGPDGNKILSKARIGETADFDEALTIIVDNYPHKDAILKGNNQGGSGNQGGGGGGSPGQKVYRRGEFEKFNPVQQAAAMDEVSQGKAVLQD